VNWDEMAVVGRIARPHGLRGQVIVNPETDFLHERFFVGAKLYTRSSATAAVVGSVTITSARFQQGRPVIGLQGVEDMNAALALAGVELRIPVEQLVALPAGTFFHHDLIGCAVETVDGQAIGEVASVENGPGASRLVVTTTQGEVLIPLVAAICTTIDPAARRIVIAPPEGLLELNVRSGRRD
jgi:16S rRNA processing protein RimM